MYSYEKGLPKQDLKVQRHMFNMQKTLSSSCGDCFHRMTHLPMVGNKPVLLPILRIQEIMPKLHDYEAGKIIIICFMKLERLQVLLHDLY